MKGELKMEEKKKFLVVVDCQNDFITGTLANPLADACVPAIVERIKQAHENDENVIFTYDTHREDYLNSTLEGKKLPIKHCIAFTKGHELDPRIEEVMMDGDDYFNKSTFGSFDVGISIEEIVDSFPEEDIEIELCGFVTSICVAANAIILRAMFPDSKITVNKNLTADVSEIAKSAALEVMKCQQIDII